MEFEIDDYVVLSEEGKKFFNLPYDELGPVFKGMRHTLSDNYYRKATESEVKTFKLKNLFTEWGNKMKFIKDVGRFLKTGNTISNKLFTIKEIFS